MIFAFWIGGACLSVALYILAYWLAGWVGMALFFVFCLAVYGYAVLTAKPAPKGE